MHRGTFAQPAISQESTPFDCAAVGLCFRLRGAGRACAKRREMNHSKGWRFSSVSFGMGEMSLVNTLNPRFFLSAAVNAMP